MHSSLKNILFLSLFVLLCGCRRSIHRPKDPFFPEITTFWSDTPKNRYYLRNSHLEPIIFTVYNESYLRAQELPCQIPSRDNSLVYEKVKLTDDLEKLVRQLQSTKKKIKKLDNFHILKQRDYNYLKHAGLMVLRHKDYPFVVKLFMENPANFIKPFNRGIEECAFFIMGGGMSRYLAGFTRIANRNVVQKKIESNRYWSELLDTPRKWYWQPEKNRYFVIQGKNIGRTTQKVLLPGTYAIICDAIDAQDGQEKKILSLLNRIDREIAISITQFLGMCIDPNVNNFMIDKQTKKIVIIDTEHFSTLVGIKEPFIINDFFTYYSRLAFKFFNNKLCCSKKQRNELQTKPQPPLYSLNL